MGFPSCHPAECYTRRYTRRVILEAVLTVSKANLKLGEIAQIGKVCVGVVQYEPLMFLLRIRAWTSESSGVRP